MEVEVPDESPGAASQQDTASIFGVGQGGGPGAGELQERPDPEPRDRGQWERTLVALTQQCPRGSWWQRSPCTPVPSVAWHQAGSGFPFWESLAPALRCLPSWAAAACDGNMHCCPVLSLKIT